MQPALTDLSDQLFFIQFTPEGTLRRRWYLVQIDIPSTMQVNPYYLSNNLYWCIFLARHPADIKTGDRFCRWWPDWYKYTTCPQSNTIIYGKRYLVRPNVTPCSAKYVQWATLLPILGKHTVVMVGPFQFEPVDSYNRVRQRVGLQYWTSLVEACILFGIPPPTIDTLVPPIITPQMRTHQQRKRKQPLINYKE